MDNEALEEEKVDIISMLAIESENEDNEDVEDEDEGDVTLEVLKERLSKRNKSLKKAKQAIHRMQEEGKTSQERMDALEQKINNVPSNDNSAEKLAQEEQDWADRVKDDPSEAMNYSNHKMAQLEDKLATFLGKLEQSVESKFGEINSRTDPERLKYQSDIAMLKSNPNFAQLDDDTLLKVAKGLKETKVKQPRGTVAGKKVLKTLDLDDNEVLSEEAKERMGFA